MLAHRGNGGEARHPSFPHPTSHISRRVFSFSLQHDPQERLLAGLMLELPLRALET